MSKLTELLTKLDDAFEQAEVKKQALADLRAKALKATQVKQTELDSLKAEHAGYVAQAERESNDAQVALERVRAQVNERTSALTGMGTDPHVSVR